MKNTGAEREGWIRTLVEDRYGRSAMTAPTASAKLSGDPTIPHDQMDNLSSGPVDKIESRLLRKSQTGEFSLNVHQFKRKKQTVLKDLKMPWGW